MKSLNKKISAIILAGMVVMGGVISSGVSSFAASASKVSIQEQQYEKVKFFVKGYGQIVGWDKDEKNLEKRYSDIYNRRLCYNNGKSVIVKNASQISVYLYQAKYSRRKFVKIQFRDFYYLIQVN